MNGLRGCVATILGLIAAGVILVALLSGKPDPIGAISSGSSLAAPAAPAYQAPSSSAPSLGNFLMIETGIFAGWSVLGVIGIVVLGIAGFVVMIKTKVLGIAIVVGVVICFGGLLISNTTPTGLIAHAKTMDTISTIIIALLAAIVGIVGIIALVLLRRTITANRGRHGTWSVTNTRDPRD
jgi:hypothetical protein